MRIRQDWRQADIFRRVPKDLTEATTTGAIISILCVLVMASLFFGEVITYISPRVQSDMVVAPYSDNDGNIRVNLDISFPMLACSHLTLDFIDILHRNVPNSMGGIKKQRIGADLKPISRETEEPKEGCRITGTLPVTKVPGNFHISSHTHGRAVPHSTAPINTQHIIHHLSFGSTDVRTLWQTAAFHPLDGTSQRDAVPQVYTYYLDVVPTTYEGVFSSTETYQFTANMNKFPSPTGNANYPSVCAFNYQISAISVRYSSGRVSFTHFLTYVCAIIGGVFTVAGLLSRFINSSTAQIQKRFMGKGD